MSKEELILHLERYERDAVKSQHDLLVAVKELRDVRAALDEHSIVAITNAAGKITYVNDKFCAISQYSRTELLGQDHRIINSHFHPKEFFRDLWSTIGQGRVWQGEIRNRAKDGSYYWVDTTIYPFLDEAERPIQYVVIRTDISRRKADEAELKQFSRELAEKNKELETIVYTVSHDLRSPLVNVQGFGKHLQQACSKIHEFVVAAHDGKVAAADLKPFVDVSIPQSLKFINAGVSKMDTLLAGILRYSRLGRIVLTIQPLVMDAMLAEIVAAMKFQLNEVGAEVSMGTLPNCLGDQGQTNQALANLLDNAVKYRSSKHPLRIKVSGKIEGGQAIYSIEDNGIGIAGEHQSKVFEIFHRLDPSGTPGEGLGLSIAQRMLERQKGKIWIESEPGKGSIFYVSLPALSS